MIWPGLAGAIDADAGIEPEAAGLPDAAAAVEADGLAPALELALLAGLAGTLTLAPVDGALDAAGAAPPQAASKAVTKRPEVWRYRAIDIGFSWAVGATIGTLGQCCQNTPAARNPIDSRRVVWASTGRCRQEVESDV
jgi:hypothetical protein